MRMKPSLNINIVQSNSVRIPTDLNISTFYKFQICIDIWLNYKVHTPTNALCIKLDKVLKFTFKITLTCSYMFRPMTIIREPSLEPS